MLFLDNRRRVGPVGKKSAKICIVGESPGAQEEREGVPFVGDSGNLLIECCHSAGIVRSDLYITNTIKERPKDPDKSEYYYEAGQKHIPHWTPKGHEFVDELYEELQSVESNILVAVGKLAFYALCRDNRIFMRRGYVHESVPEIGKRKVIPIIHPAAALHGSYITRYYIARDFRKVKIESGWPEIRRPDRRIILPRTTDEKYQWLEYYAKQKEVSFDIEVSTTSFQVTCISFSSSPDQAVSINLCDVPTIREEADLWLGTADILEDRGITKIGQNIAAFDGPYLARRCNILLQGPIVDTLIAHRIMYPEFRSSLAFLGSCYCGAQEYWKDMVHIKDLRDDGDE